MLSEQKLEGSWLRVQAILDREYQGVDLIWASNVVDMLNKR